ncbi:3,4-dihydroxy-2-butanone-4-phosphate synthase [Spirochaeta cellobiosiphila]|uniref:3,4-dihydroxy-2-butanone-4-phosphate synthase n=1 Tax=Spirochaeta cellobiosiphila TaxID=504483 RepID=UPI000405C512|nr:3,4-dihydroxy-2-butanone-4-phosphate synthase [Spirochaeta cellobiosiphila]
MKITTEQAIDLLKDGQMIILTDDKNRENEGDILFLAHKAQKEHVDFLTREARGLICVALSPERADQFQLLPMVTHNESVHKTAFTLSVDANNGGTGISVHDRWEAIKALGADQPDRKSLVSPGHVFPLRAQKGGLWVRQGHTEGAVALAELAQEQPAMVICEILGKGEDMARGQELIDFAKTHHLGILSMNELQDYLVKGTARTLLQTEWGELVMETYPPEHPEQEPPFLLYSPHIDWEESFDLRIHSECLTGEVLGSRHCDCREQLQQSIKHISRTKGALLYLRQEGRGIGLAEKIKAYALQQEGQDTYEANESLGHAPDSRDYHYAARILRSKKVSTFKLLTNNPDKVENMRAQGFQIERLSWEIEANDINRSYLKTKKIKFHHHLQGV